MTYLKNFIKDEEGQDLVEYALLLGFIALAAVLALTFLGSEIGLKFSTLGSQVTAAS